MFTPDGARVGWGRDRSLQKENWKGAARLVDLRYAAPKRVLSIYDCVAMPEEVDFTILPDPASLGFEILDTVDDACGVFKAPGLPGLHYQPGPKTWVRLYRAAKDGTTETIYYAVLDARTPAHPDQQPKAICEKHPTECSIVRKASMKYARILASFYGKAWALPEDLLRRMQDLLQSQAAGEKWSNEEIRDRIADANRLTGYEDREHLSYSALSPRSEQRQRQKGGSVALIPILGHHIAQNEPRCRRLRTRRNLNSNAAGPIPTSHERPELQGDSF